VFEIAKVPGGKGTWAATAIATFAGGTDGEVPPVYPEPPVQALSLTMPKAGVIFGLSTATVYELRKQSDGTWVKTNLSSYDGGDGSSAWALTASANGKHLFAPGGPSGGGRRNGRRRRMAGRRGRRTRLAFRRRVVFLRWECGDRRRWAGRFPDVVLHDQRGRACDRLVPIGAPFKTLDEQGSACIQVSYPATGEVKLTNTCARVVGLLVLRAGGREGDGRVHRAGEQSGIFDTGYLDAKKSVALAVTLGAGQVASGWAQSCDEGEYPVLTRTRKACSHWTVGCQ